MIERSDRMRKHPKARAEIVEKVDTDQETGAQQITLYDEVNDRLERFWASELLLVE